jgi:hypothetical protein
VLFLVLKQNFVWFGAWLLLPNVIGNSLLASLNRRLLLRETQIASTQSRGYSFNTNMFRAGYNQSQTDLTDLKDLKDRNVEVFQEAERSMDRE